MPKHLISKPEAARRQLEVAINLYFYDRDFVSVHTLAAAASRLLRDLHAHRGSSATTIRDHFLERVKPEHHATVLSKMKEAENFFKHADRDPSSTLEFNPGQTEFIIWDAIAMYGALTGETPPVLGAFVGWFIVQNPGPFRLSEDFEMARVEAEVAMKRMPKSEALDALVHSRMKLAKPRGFGA